MASQSKSVVLSGRSLVGVLAALGVLAGCPASGDEVRPPSDQIFFPTALSVTPSEDYLLVTNANSDLRYDSGAVSVVDLAAVNAAALNWIAGQDVSGCSADGDIPTIAQCEASEFLLSDAGVRIGNFATAIDVQQLDDGSYRLFTVVRGDPSITWINMAQDGTLECGESSSSFPLCDAQNRMVRVRGDDAFPVLTSEPFNIFVDGERGYAVVSHITTDSISVVKAPRDGRDPEISDLIGGFFAPDPLTGVRGAYGVAGRSPGQEGGFVYLSSRTEDRVQMLTVNQDSPHPLAVPSEYFFLGGVQPSSESRNLRFYNGGDRLAILNREPPSVLVYDTSLDNTGFPKNAFLRGADVCNSAADLQVLDAKAYVACFGTGEVWVIDLERGWLDSVIQVGRGPSAITSAPLLGMIFVANFVEDTVAVIDVRDGEPTKNTVVMRIGIPRQVREE